LKLFPKNASYYFTNAHIPRAMPVAELAEKAAMAGLTGNSFDNVNEAVAAAKNNATADDVIMICGSFFVLAEMDF
jgi:dihydrofolate synthase / folylpolyglutamate synthase